MKREGWADYPFSFHDREELGPAILAKISKEPGSDQMICRDGLSPNCGRVAASVLRAAGVIWLNDEATVGGLTEDFARQ